MSQEKGPVGQNYRGLRDKSGVLTEKGRVNSIIINKILITIIIIITRKTNYRPWIGRWLCGFFKIANWSYCWGIRHSPPLFLPWPASPAPPKTTPGWVPCYPHPDRYTGPSPSIDCIRAASTNKNKSFTDSCINKYLLMSWPQRKLTPGATNLEKLPTSDSMNGGPLVHQWSGNWPIGMKEGLKAPPFGSTQQLINMGRKLQPEWGQVAQFGQLDHLRGVTNIKWQFRLVMKMPRSWSNWLFVHCRQ